MNVSTIGLDLGKRVFQVHGVDAAGAVVVCKRLRRREVLGFFGRLAPCVVGMEACGSAHYWARELAALGHEVRLMAPSYVKPYVKRMKNDAADAAAICEAVTRPSMRFVAIKTAAQQGVLVVHRAREMLVRQRTMVVNALRAHLAEFGIGARRGRGGVEELVEALAADGDGLPAPARAGLAALIRQLRAAEAEIKTLDREIEAWHRATPASRLLATIPGIGPITASALVATVGDGGQFESGRHLAAWLGMVPRQDSTGGKTRLGRISKQGDRYLRRLLVIGATALLRHGRRRAELGGDWVEELLARRPKRLVSVALANKMARIAWAVLTRGEPFRPRAVAGAR
jgi:transposase